MSTNSLPKTQHVVLFDEVSDSYDVIKYVEVETPKITSPTDVVIKNKFAGINFIEGYFRKGFYPAELPYIFGREASGEVVAVGDKVTKYKVGDKIAYIKGETFAQYTKISEDWVQALKLDPNTPDELLKVYGSALLQGLTALTFINEAHKVNKDEFILVWAAAGGVGRLLVQLIAQKGARVIAVASTDDKLAIVKELGAEYLINSSTEDVTGRVNEITGGKGVHASFDSVGKDTFDISLQALTRKGTFVSYGNSSGLVPPFPISRLAAKNIKILRPQLYGYITTQEEWEHYSSTLLKLLASGDLKFEISKSYPLKDYKQAAAELEGRKTTAKLVLEIP